MTREEKSIIIADLTTILTDNNVIYLADISDLNATDTSNLRRACFKADVKMSVVKNTLLAKAMERSDKDFGDLPSVLHGNTSMMIANDSKAPALLIKNFRKTSDRPILKGAYVLESVYVGDEQLDNLVNLKSKEDLIGDVINMLQSPMRNVISALQSGGNTLSGVLKTLSEK
ncbi:MAG: 50S ribosomal protein L10 [Flavobacteriaceae bacterium]|nr:50S ribosomal protein L10 [Flavobacteriaceae bacterium]